MLGILDLLAMRGFDVHRPAKLVRHQTSTYPIHELRLRGWLDVYQAFQGRPVFDGLDYIISFVGLKGRRAKFNGVYRVLGRRSPLETDLPSGCPYNEWLQVAHFYGLERLAGFEDLEDRVIIDWGRGALAWAQKLSNKEVLELLPKGQLLEPFADYLDFTLSFSELQHLYRYEEGNKQWRARLSAVAGVYLVLATTSGTQYVGSAHGAEGIWGRWAAYARNGHGGNVKLRALVAAEPAYPLAFSYSVLQILPRTLARLDVLAWETRYKQKLGSRATGLNV